LTDKFNLSKEASRLVVLQRINLIEPFLKKIRKFFGRSLFTTFFTRYFLNPDKIGKNYYKAMNDEFNSIKHLFEPSDNSYLSIGAGMGGLELIINNNFKNIFFNFIEKNYVSKKVTYGWNEANTEGYHDFKLQESFLLNNGLDFSKFKIYDFDKDDLPVVKFDVVISLLSLDYHYNFNIYLKYLKKVCNNNTKVIFDTIRPDYFLTVFKNVKIISVEKHTVHKSKRIICNEFII
jgi:hypothetical protein